MIVLTVLLKQTAQITQFYFEHFKDADAVLRAYDSGFESGSNPKLCIEDDFGSKAVLQWRDISLVSLSDMDKEMEAREKMEWAKVQVNMRLQKKVQESPAAKLLVPNRGIQQ